MPAQVDWQLAKSRGRELDVTLRVDPFLDEDYVDDADIEEVHAASSVRSSNAAYASNLQKVFAESPRIRELKVTLYHVAEWPDLVHEALNDGRIWPRLTHLLLHNYDHWEEPATFDMVLPEVQVLHLDSITAVDWTRLKLGPALSSLDIRDTLGFRELSTQLPLCCSIRKMKLMDWTRAQDVLSFDALAFGAISFPQLEELTIWWETIDEQSLIRFLAACPNLRDLDVTIENLAERDIVDDTDIPDYTLCLMGLSLSIIESGSRQDLFGPLASKLSGEYLRALTIDNLLLDARNFLPFLFQCRSTLKVMHFQYTHLTNIARAPRSGGEFPRLSKLKLDLQCEPASRFGDSNVTVPPGDIDLTTSLFLSILPPSPPARSMDVRISGAPLGDEYIRRLVAGIVGPGSIRLDVIYHDYGGRPPEHEIKISNGHPGKPFTCSFATPDFAHGFRAICMVSELRERIVRLSVDTARAPHVFLQLQ
ncbi:hypothetical protein EXIGLDRAFT_706448 [Exidia glandulosa HHB12029]|uniref:RNI-like protein n=1 Tax=Exidia glandulosa HHB12029 TaxID=1314781 RepID=A0A165K6E7_EXIGL|nr:hypothetical protein EXIGLDRAFT_706448 [Exidia glandulosa HHB12029]